MRRRVALVREQLDRPGPSASFDLRELESAAAALSVACEQLRELARPQKVPNPVTPVSSESN